MSLKHLNILKNISKVNIKTAALTSTNVLFPCKKEQWTEDLKFTKANLNNPIPMYRLLNEDGKLIDKLTDPQLPKLTLLKIYRDMVFVNNMDKIFYDAQRQGRISFYMTNSGEEGAQIGSAAALDVNDVVYSQYREVGVLVWRGFTAQEFADQCYGNVSDLGKGKQMPVHYGKHSLNFVTISSPLGTQVPQAVGAAYALKNSNQIVICYFGDGAASEGDVHAAFNFSATLNCPIIFFCRNNRYAISTPTDEQYCGDGIAGRGPSYGISTIRVDGNDVLAVYNAVKFARNYCILKKRPVLIEAMTYRTGHHSTSDDSSAYRSQEEVNQWALNDNPIKKLQKYLENQNYWTNDEDLNLNNSVRKEILDAFMLAEKKLKPKWTELFHGTYEKLPQHLRKEMKKMEIHVKKFEKNYPTQMFSK